MVTGEHDHPSAQWNVVILKEQLYMVLARILAILSSIIRLSTWLYLNGY